MTKLFMAGCAGASLVCGVLCGPANAAPVTVADALDLKARAEAGAFSARAEWVALTYYLQGVTEGAVGYHKAMEQQGGETLFCPPQGASNSLDEIIASLSNVRRQDRSRPLVSVVVEKFSEKYPCRR